jgi:hypothetical protein
MCRAHLGAKCIGHVGPTTGEPGNSPLIRIVGVRGVPGLVGTVKVADPQMHNPHWGGWRRIGQRTG